MEEWRRMYPEDVEIEQAFWCEKKPERKRARAKKRWRMRAWIGAQLAGPSTLDGRWLDVLLASEESSNESVNEE
jgi:hypothetical protein